MDNPVTDQGGPATPPLPLDKPALRRVLRDRRRAFAGGAFPVPEPLMERLRPGMIVAGYHPVGSEADPRTIAHLARARGCLVALPHVVDRTTRLRFLLVDDGAVLEDGPFGLRNPKGGQEVAPDIVLTPVVGFDRRGGRLGQGAGHYDRAFAAHPAAWRIGIAWSVQEVPALPVDPWDVPLHAIATEREWVAVR